MLDLLYRDKFFLAVNKPSGLLTQGPPEIDSVEAQVRAWRRTNETANAANADPKNTVYVGVPHRLDRPVSGILLIGLDRKSTKHLADQFERREVDKTYWAIVDGHVEPSHGTWSDYMRKLPTEARSETVPKDHPDAQLAVLRYKVLCPFEESTLLQIKLETGRTHQIRVQAAARGHAILGDQQYGSTRSFGPQTDDVRQRHIALHARRLELKSAPGGGPWSVIAPLSAAWRETPQIELLGLE